MSVPVVSVTFTRPIVGGGDLVITNDPTAGTMHLPEDWLVRPDFDFRRTYAPTGPFTPGQQILSAVLEASTLPLVILCHSTTTALLRAAEATLTAAVGQFAYDVTVTVDGQTETWAADPSWPHFGDVDSGMVAAHISRAVLTIPINPA
jgi:hypothetical protein